MIRLVLSAPGIPRVFLASLIGRLPIGAMSLILILRTREMTGSYAAGGAVAAANALGHGIAGPPVGRIVDRRGQTGALLITGGLFLLAMLAFALLPDQTPLAVTIACGALAGAAYPPLGPALRALWSAQIQDPDRRHAAFTFESIVFEFIYILGPLLLVGAVGAWSLRAGAVACGAISAAGTLMFALAPASRAWAPHPAPPSGRAGALRGAGVRVLLGALLLLGVAIAAVELAVAAFVDDETMAGVMLALWGVGSAVGGMLMARRGAPPDPPGFLARMLLVLAITTAPLIVAGSDLALAFLMVLAGLAISPSLATAFGLLGAVAPPGTTTEAYALIATGFGGGIAAGAAVAGVLVEQLSVAAAFALAVAAIVGAAATIAAGAAVLRRAGPLRPSPAPPTPA